MYYVLSMVVALVLGQASAQNNVRIPPIVISNVRGNGSRLPDQSDQKSTDCPILCAITFMNGWAIETAGLGHDSGAPVGNALHTDHAEGIPNLSSLLSGIAQTNGSVEIIDKLCTLRTNHEECLEKCSSDVLKDLMLRSLVPLRFLCTQEIDEYKKQLPCLARNDPLIKNICAVPAARLQALRPFLRRLENLPLSFRPELTERYCVETLDHLNCTLPAIAKLCSSAAAHLMVQVLNQSLANVEDFFNHEKLLFPLSTSCQRLAGFETEFNFDDKEVTTKAPAPPTTQRPRTDDNSAAEPDPDLIMTNPRKSSITLAAGSLVWLSSILLLNTL